MIGIWLGWGRLATIRNSSLEDASFLLLLLHLLVVRTGSLTTKACPFDLCVCGCRCWAGHAATDAGAGLSDSISRWQLWLCVEPAPVGAGHIHGTVCPGHARPHAVRRAAGARFCPPSRQPGERCSILNFITSLLLYVHAWL